MQANDNALQIGGVTGTSYPNRFAGLIDEVRLWNVARSQTELQEMMSRPLSGEEAGLVGYWRFDEGSGQGVNDSSPNGHNGQLGSTGEADSYDPAWTAESAPLSSMFTVVVDNTANSSLLLDYQVAITLDTTTLISEGRMRSDCGDIRFYDADYTTPLNYWLERDCNSPTTRLWVKLPLIPAEGAKKLYLTCGDNGLTSASDGEAVFEFFDHFDGPDGAALDSTKWITDAINTVTASIQDNKYYITDGARSGNAYWFYNDSDVGNQDQAKFSLPQDFVVEWLSTVEDTSSDKMGQGGIALVDGSNQIEAYLNHEDPQGNGISLARLWRYASISGSETATSGETKKFAIRRQGSTVAFYIDEEFKEEGTMSGAPAKLAISVGTYGGYPYLDYVALDDLRVRQYTSPEPTTRFASAPTWFDPDLILILSGPEEAPLGGSIGYELLLLNNSAVVAANTRVTHTLPLSVAFAGASISPTRQIAGELVWELDDLGASQTVNLIVTGTVNSSALPGSSLVSTATVGSDLAEANLVNNTAAFTSMVVSSPATELALTAPAEVDLLAPFSVTVTAYDAYGNPTASYTGVVELSSTDSSADLPPAHQFTTGDGGVYTFTNLSLETPGLQTLTATDGTLTATVPITVDDFLVIVDRETTWDAPGVTLGTLVVTGTDTILTLVGSTAITAENIIVGPGARISADGEGYGPATGYEGQSPGNSRGGHHGGRGGNNPWPPYGDLYHPTTWGSGGGNSAASKGGSGGGALKLIVTDSLIISGTLSVNGFPGGANWTYVAGGGAGGSIWITAGILSGNGAIRANGGRGASAFGGQNCAYSGGGGRIAVYAPDNSLVSAGTIEVSNPAPNNCPDTYRGEPGTIYLNKVDPLTSTIEIGPAAAPANGVAAGTITVTLRYTDGLPIAGEPVSVTLTTRSEGDPARTYVTGTLLSAGQVFIGLTNEQGVATAPITSTETGTRTLWAYAGLVRLVPTATIYFDPDVVDAENSTIHIEGNSTIKADGSETTDIVVTARDRFGNLVPGIETTLGATPTVTITPLDATTDQNGEARYQISHNEPAQAVLSATVESLTGTLTVGNVVTVTFQGPDLAVSKTGPPAETTAGFPVTYTLTIANEGLLTATNVVITDALPAGLSFVAQQSDGLTFTQSGSDLTWQASALGLGESTGITLTAQVDGDLAEGTTITNTLTAAAETPELDLTNNTAQTTHPVERPKPLLVLSPGAPALTVARNQTGTLTMTIENRGLLTMTGLVVTAPGVMPWVNITPAGTGLPDLLPDQQTVLTLTAAPGEAVRPGSYRDFVTVTEASGGEQRAVLRVNVLPPTRTAQLTIINDQSAPVSGAWVGLLLADGLVDVTPAFTNTLDVTAEGTTGPEGLLTLADLPLGVYEYTLQADHHLEQTGLLTVTADPLQQPLPVTLTLTAQPHLEVTTAAPALSVAAGETGSQEFTIANNGAAPLSGLEITLPPNLSWLYLAIPSALTGALEAGESRQFTLFAAPPATLTDQIFTNQPLVVSAAGGEEVTKELTIHVTGELTGELEIEVTGAGGQPLEDATVALVRQAVITQVTGSRVITFHQQFITRTTGTGSVYFTSLPVGSYNYRITRPGYKAVEGIHLVLPVSHLASAGLGRTIGLASPNETALAQGEQNGRLIVSLEEAPFNYHWQVTRTEQGYTIELTITQNNDAEGLSLIAPTRRWQFATCDTDTLTDSILLLNPSDSVITPSTSSGQA